MGYWNDSRYGRKEYLFNIDETRMLASILLCNEDGDEIEKRVAIKFRVCDTCHGKGSHTNPNIDSHGISAQEFQDDPDFAESYFNGDYDVVCVECSGKRVSVYTTDKEAQEHIKQREEDDYYDRQVMAAECGWR